MTGAELLFTNKGEKEGSEQLPAYESTRCSSEALFLAAVETLTGKHDRD